MSGINKILVAVADPKAESQPSLDRALSLAQQFGAKIRVFTCVYNQYIAGERFFDSPGLLKSRQTLVGLKLKVLEQTAERIRTEGIEATADAAWDYPIHEGIVREILRYQPDIVVVDTHARPKHLRLQLTNTDWQLIRDCPCPLLLVKQSGKADYRTIIAAVDPLHEHDKPAALDHRILDTAEQIAESFAGKVHVVHSFQPIVSTALGGVLEPEVLPIQTAEDKLEEYHREELDRLIADHEVLPENVHLRAGDTEDVLPELVTQLGASLVLMGAVSRSLIKRLFIGSTAEKVLDKLTCDVLIIKPKDFETPVEPSSDHPGIAE